MKKLLLALLLAVGSVASAQVATVPVPVIFDTDMGNDIDEALALAMLHALASRGEVKLLATTISKGNTWAEAYVRLVNDYYGRSVIPIGMVRDGKAPEDGLFIRQVSERHGRKPESVPEAAGLLRQTLAGEKDGSVAMILAGFSTNLDRLLVSAPDQYSPLTGMELVKRKVKLLTVMAGNFVDSHSPEYNVKVDRSAAAEVFSQWPTPIVFSGVEIGNAVLYPASSIEHDFAEGNPVAEAYRLYRKMPYDRPSWDLTAVLYAVRSDRGYFDLSEPGKVLVGPDGATTFELGGDRRYLRVNAMQAARVREACVWLTTQPK